MVHFVGLDVSVKETSVCVVDDAGKVILEQTRSMPTPSSTGSYTTPIASISPATACAKLDRG
jgi:predicted NBD/HSP70 family sugar kinase